MSAFSSLRLRPYCSAMGSCQRETYFFTKSASSVWSIKSGYSILHQVVGLKVE